MANLTYLEYPSNIDKDEYYNLTDLIKASNFKKIMIRRNSWGENGWAIVNKIRWDETRAPQYACNWAFGYIRYHNGDSESSTIPCPGTYAWKLIKVINEDMQVSRIDK